MSNQKRIQWNTTAEEIISIYNTDLTGKVAIVTGSNSGIGLETARVLSMAGAKVIIPCKTLEKSNEAIRYIKQQNSTADLVPIPLDLSDLSSIKQFTEEFLALNIPLNILINNAGVMGFPESYTKDGFESHFGINHLGHFYLTLLLSEKLKASAPARVVVMSSSANYHFLDCNGIDFDNLNGQKHYNPAVAYGQSKLANILFAKELQNRFKDTDVTVTSVHPGAVNTHLGRYLNRQVLMDCIFVIRSYWAFIKDVFVVKDVKQGASTTIFCATSPDVDKGGYYADNTLNYSLLNEQANNKKMAEQLWEVSLQLIGDKI